MFKMLTLVVLFALCTFIPAVSGQVTPTVTFQYTVFYRGDGADVQDGENNTGVFCRPGLGAVALDNYSVAFSDMCGPGSAIRLINWTTEGSTISTLAGSLFEIGDVDGNATEARFRGMNDGSQFANGLTRVNDDLYLADTNNNAIRRISLPEADVSTYINASIAPSGTGIGQPAALAPFQSSNDTTVLFVSDTENNRILYVPLNSLRIVVPTYATGTQPGWLAVEYSSQYIFTVSESTTLLVHPINSAGSWTPYGNTSCMGNPSALLLTETEPPELLYFGTVGGIPGIYGIQANLALDVANVTCPTLRYSWTVPDESVVALIDRNSSEDSSIFALTSHGLYALSNREIPMPTNTTTTTSSSSPPTPTEPPGTRAIAGFPAGSLPHATLCERSGAYAAIFSDILAALGNNDNIYMRLIDLNNNSYVYYSRNTISEIATMCNVSADNSTDNTVSFVEIYDPEGRSSEDMSAAMAASNFTNTRNYLANYVSRGEQLDPFCFINCTATQCPFMSMRNITCPSTPLIGSSKCDGLCKGAIAASTVLGVSGAGLLALLVLSPGTIFSALVMIPII